LARGGAHGCRSAWSLDGTALRLSHERQRNTGRSDERNLRIRAQRLEIEAYCPALEAAILELGERGGIPRDEFQKRIHEAYQVILQNSLERVETTDPATAAQLDDSPIYPPAEINA